MADKAIGTGATAPVVAGAQAYELFVSDLHLAPERPAARAAFSDFLRTTATRAHTLYILGDLFDYWIGDDDLIEPFHAAVVAEIAHVSRSGCTVYLMHGNRDFLLGERFASACGATLLQDPTVIEQAGTRTMLLHGDTLCVDDPDYQCFRAKVRTKAWQREFTAKPLAERRTMALNLRSDSQSSQQTKSEAIMDVAPRAVADAYRRHACRRMIHGHTHRPARHEHLVDGRLCERWVLADWYDSGSYLRCDVNGRCEPVEIVPDRPDGRT